MELSGHTGEVFCAKFDPNGNYIASGSMDRSICKPIILLTAMRMRFNGSSTLADVWRMRKLRCIDGAQGRGTRFTLVSRLESFVFSISGYALG